MTARIRADSTDMLRRLLGFGDVHRSVPLKTLRRHANAMAAASQTLR